MNIIAADALDVPLSQVKVVWGDTDTCPYSVGESGSRTTTMTGEAIVVAARDLKKQIADKGMPAGTAMLKASATPQPRIQGKIRNCFGANFGANPGECDNTLPASAPTVPTGTKARLLTRLYAPDTVNCSVLGGRAADLEIRLRTDDTPQVTVAGGDNVNSFKYTTGPRSDIGFGYSQYFWIEVGLREGGNTAPAQFGVRCMTGNGMMEPRFIDTPADDF
jgi:hypothetical protein